MVDILGPALMLLWLALPLLACAANAMKSRSFHPFLLFLLNVVAGFLLLGAGAWVSDAHLHSEMNRFDLDGDGGIGGSELTPDAQKAIADWSNDTGRTMVIFIGMPLSATWTGICFVVLCVGKWIVVKAIPARCP